MNGSDIYAEGELVVRATAEESSVTQHPKGTFFGSGELNEEVVCAIFAHTTQHGTIPGKVQTQSANYYNLDAFISGIPSQDHFSRIGKMVILGSGAEHFISDYDFNLSRYACYTEYGENRYLSTNVS